jgi:hypothetical protein
MSDCGARMKPIGLRFKDLTENPFTGRITGELMIVHECLNCGKITSNRIAGDDDPEQILMLLQETHRPELTTGLSRMDITLLSETKRNEVLSALYGNGR